jgi:hypothetical protein
MTGFLALGVLTAKLMTPPQQAARARGAAAQGQQWLRPRRSAADRTGRGFADDVGTVSAMPGMGMPSSPSPGSGSPAGLWLDRSFHHADSRDAQLREIEPTNPMPITQPTDLGTHTSPTADPTNRGER